MQGLVCVTAFVVLGAGVASAQPQGNLQQKCINKINKDMIKVQAAQGKLNAGCVKDAVKTGSNAETCLAADAKMKVATKRAKTVSDETKKCTGLMPAPAFAFTGAANQNDAAEQAAKDLVHDVFGSPVDSGLFLCDTNPTECLCQRQTIDRVEKLSRAISKIFVKCKNQALAIGHDPFPVGAASASDVADCLTNASTTNGLSVQADTKGKVADATTQLSDTITNFCTVGGEFDAGVCTGLSGNPLVACLAQRVKCRSCLMLNDGDGLANNCSMWSGTTCP
jgi:hypothetical protein